MTSIHVLSERKACHHISWANNFELEDIISSSCGAEVLAPGQIFAGTRLEPITGRLRKGRYNRLEPVGEGADLLLLVGMGPLTLRMLNAIPHWRERYRVVTAYIVDMYPPSEKTLDLSIVRQLDALFVSYSQIQSRIQDALRVPTFFLPQAADVLGAGGYYTDRRIDVAAFGRQPSGVLESIIESAVRPGSDMVAWWSPKTSPYTSDMQRDRFGFLTLLRRARISLCYRFEDSNPHTYRGVSPITARWFEAAAAGCAIVGSRPSAQEGQSVLGWDDAVIPLSTDGAKCVAQLRELLADKVQLEAIGRSNQVAAAGAHDWRHRVSSLLETLSLRPAPRLVRELETLDEWGQGGVPPFAGSST